MKPDIWIALAIVVALVILLEVLTNYGQRYCISCRAPFAVFKFHRCYKHRVRS